MTPEQAIALASARLRLQKQAAPPPPKAETVGETLAKDVDEDWTKAAQTGIARSAMKTVRGLGTTLLPKSAEAWAEKEGYLPSARDIEILGEGGKNSGIAQGTEVAGDVLTSLAPTGAAARATARATQALPTAARLAALTTSGAATGAAQEGILAEEGKVADAMKSGAMWGAAGEAAPRIGGEILSRVLPSTAAMKAGMDRGLKPTMGQGIDPTSWRGAVVKNAEDVLQVAPMSGAPLRSAKNKGARSLFEEGARIVDPNVVPEGNMSHVVDQLRQTTSNAYREPLDKVRIPVQRATAQLNTDLSTLARKNNLAPAIEARISAELDGLMSGAAGRAAPAKLLEDAADSISSSLGSGAESQVRKEMAGKLRGMVDASTRQVGLPMTDVREAKKAYHILNRAVPKGSQPAAGISGERLQSAIRANDEKIGASAGGQLAQLAEEGAGIAPAARAYGMGNPAQLVKWGAELAGLGTGGLANAALLGYGGLQHTQLPKLLLGDKATKEAFVEALRNPAYRAVALGMDEEQ